MRKIWTFALAIIVFFVLSSGVVMAQPDKTKNLFGQPFIKLFEILKELEEKLENITLLPGPPGPPGEPGEPGSCSCDIGRGEFDDLVSRVAALEVAPAPECAINDDCDDGNVCTDNVCTSGACQYTNNSAVCDDNDPDTINDYCQAGVCAGEQPSAAVNVIITEIMTNPDCVTDANGEWIELYNDSASDVNLENWSLGDAGSDAFTIISSLVLPAYTHIVFCKNIDTATNGNVACDLAYNGLTLSNGDDEVILMNATGDMVDEVYYDSANGNWAAANTAGASIQLDTNYYNAADNDNGLNWCSSTVTINAGCGDWGTPGSSNGVCN